MAIINTVTNSEWFKGNAGEEIVKATTENSLDNKIYRILNDVTISARNGTTQIDHILISKYGVFVIETKHLKGLIFGNQYQKNWTQVIYKNKIQIPNPIHQNYGHVKNLQSIIKLNDDQIHSIVVFTGESELRTKMPKNVVTSSGYIEFVRSKTIEVFSDSKVSALISKIESERYKRSRMNRSTHESNVKVNQ